MASRLADILQQEYKTKGLVGGTVSALGKSSREKMDVRNKLFGGSGLGSIIGRKVFGKGYSATAGSNKASGVSESISSGSSRVLQEISISSSIAAKNSMSLPMMARDMNVMRQGIVKLVKLQGGTQRDKADRFFMSASDREKSYEAQFNKSGKSKTPSIVGKEKEKDSGGILGLLTSLFGGLATKLLSFGSIVTGLVATFVSLGALLMGTVSLITGLIKMLPGGKLLLKGLKLGALLTGGLFAANALAKPNSETSSDTDNKRTILDRAGQATSGVIGAAVANQGLKFGSSLGNKAPKYSMVGGTIAEKGGKMVKATNVGKNKKLGEMLEKLRTFSVKITKKKQKSLFLKLLGERLGKAIAFKAVTMFASFAAAPFTAGASLLITIASAALLGYEIYQIYDAIFGDDGIEKALDATEKAKSPTSEDGGMSFESALLDAFEFALGLKQETPKTSSPTPVPPALPKAGTPEAISAASSLGGQQQTYATLGGGELGPDALAATGVNADLVDNTSSTSPSKVSQGGVSEDLVNYVKRKEGFTPTAKKDYAQFSIGYGTKANSPTEGPITEAEADNRLRAVLAKSQKNVIDHAAKYGYDWDQKKIDALTSFTYNLGPGALNQLTANGTRKNDEIGKKILEYNKAGGQTLPGLVARRSEESTTFSSGVSLVASSPNTGNRVSSGSTALAPSNNPSASGPTNIDNKIINNNTQAGRSGSGAQAIAYDTELAKLLTVRMSASN